MISSNATYFLQTKRVGFRLWTNEDLILAQSLWGDPSVTQWITADGTMTPAMVEERLAQEQRCHAQFGIQYWPIFRLDSNTFIGCCGLRPYGSEASIMEFGVHILHDHWGQGYATEAGLGCLRYAFETLAATSLFAGHHPSNQTSRHLLTKLGFLYTHNEYYAPTGLEHPSYTLTPASTNRTG